MFTNKLHAGSDFPKLSVSDLSGNLIHLAKANEPHEWRMVVVYRGLHCPLCTKYLNALEGYRETLSDMGIDIVAVSADSKAQLAAHKERLQVSFPLGYGLSVEDMQALGLYISTPRSEQETDHTFAEPGLFIINGQGTLQAVDISNNPFMRPDLEQLVTTLAWVRNPENNYPVRGTWRN